MIKILRAKEGDIEKRKNLNASETCASFDRDAFTGYAIRPYHLLHSKFIILWTRCVYVTTNRRLIFFQILYGYYTLPLCTIPIQLYAIPQLKFFSDKACLSISILFA